MQDKLVIAVDGGGLTTDCVLTDQTGKVLASIQAGTSNQNRVGFATAVEVLKNSINILLEKSGFNSDQAIEVAVFGLAGVDTAADRTAMHKALLHTARKVLIMNDSMLPLGMLPKSEGVAIIAGTGSICCGSYDGQTVRCGGHGHDFDEGSGRWIAHRALEVACRLADGRTTSRHAHMFQRLVFNAVQQSAQRLIREGQLSKNDLPGSGQIEVVSDLYKLLYRSGDSVSTNVHRDIVPAIFEAAESGLPEAWQLVDQGARELSLHVNAVATKLSLEEVPLAVAGSLLVLQPFYRTLLMNHLIGLDIRLSSPMVVVDKPLDGALRIAWRQHDTDLHALSLSLLEA